MLHLVPAEIVAEIPSGARCVDGFPPKAASPVGEDSITPTSGGNDCQPFHKHQGNAVNQDLANTFNSLHTLAWTRT